MVCKVWCGMPTVGKRFLLAWLTCAVVSLVGCASNKAREDVGQVEAINRLNEAVESVSSQLTVLRATQQATAAPTQNTRIYTAPDTGTLTRAITLNWSGALVPAVRSIAQLTGYEFKVLGDPPASPPLVHVDATQTPAFEVLQDIGWQAGEGIGVIVDDEAATPTIAITYNGDST